MTLTIIAKCNSACLFPREIVANVNVNNVNQTANNFLILLIFE